MKTYFVLLGALLCLNLAQAQKIDQIRKKAQAHKDKSKKTKSSSVRDRRRTAYPSASRGEVAGDGIGSLFRLLNLLIAAAPSPEKKARLDSLRFQRRLIRKMKTEQGLLNPHFRFSLLLSYGSLPNLYQSIRPRFRLQLGIVSSDLRYSLLREERVDRVDQFNTIDWQVLQFHLLNRPAITGLLGLGFVQVQSTEATYPELASSWEFQWMEGRIRLAPEFRLAWDPDLDNGIIVRNELNASLTYALIRQKEVKLYLGLQALRARFFESVNLWSLGFGLVFRMEG